MDNTNSQKYGVSPKKIEEKSLESKNFWEVYDFQRMVRVSKDADRYERADINADKKSRRRLCSPLTVGKKVLALAKRLKKKDVPGNLYESTTDNMSFFNQEQIFIVRKVVPRDELFTVLHDYWISKTENGEIIHKRFLRQELFALNNQFE